MKTYIVLILAAFSISCGNPGGSSGGSAVVSKPSVPVAPVTHIYSMQVSGDVDFTGSGDAYALTMTVNQTDPDVQTIATGTTGPIVNGQTITYNLTGRYLRATQINKMNDTTPEAGLQAKLYRDGVLVQTSPVLHVGGTYQLFNNLD